MLNTLLKYYRHIFYEIYKKGSKKQYWRDPILLPAMTLGQLLAISLYPIDIFIIVCRLADIKIVVHISQFMAMIIVLPLGLLHYIYLTGEIRLKKTIAEFENESKEERRKWRIFSLTFFWLPWIVMIYIIYSSI